MSQAVDDHSSQRPGRESADRLGSREMAEMIDVE